MDARKIIEALSPNERRIIQYLKDDVKDICRKSNLDKTSVIRALEYLQNKGIIRLSSEKKKIIELGVNGALYRKKGLPERRLLSALSEKSILRFAEAQKQAGLSDEEFKVSIGVLKKKAMIGIKNGKIILSADRKEVSKKTLEEIFLESLPLEYDSLSPEMSYALKSLQNRKDIIHINEKKRIDIEVTELGNKIMNSRIGKEEMIEQITPEMLKNEKLWKGKKFRRYDILSSVPEIHGGKRHFVNQAIDYARRVWTEMGFQEMTGSVVVSSFWAFDSLFTPQDHPAREMHDTFFLSKVESKLPDKKIVNAVKTSHEKGIGGSKGWNYKWDEKEAKKTVLRTHTTCLSAHTLSNLNLKDLPQKFFAIGKVFRNETVDWSHGFEFYQTEGIVVDKNADFRHLLGYLNQFYKKMGFEKVRFRPSYFPYTEPSVEIEAFHPVKKVWLELGGAGIFRPEITIPLLEEPVPVLAWGQGFDRIIIDYYKINDLRELYKNDVNHLRKIRFWMK